MDGGWWPRSLDLSAELPTLLREMASAGCDVHRVTYNLGAWDPAPRRLNTVGGLVKLDGYHRQDAAAISVVDSTDWTRIDLVVVPPSTPAAAAERALTLAGLDGDRHCAGDILPALPVPAAG